MPEGIGYGKSARKRVSSKVKKVKKEIPGLSHKAQVGKALGILRSQSKKRGQQYPGSRALG